MNNIPALSPIQFPRMDRCAVWVHTMIWCLLLVSATQADPIGSPITYPVIPGTMLGIVELDGESVDAGAVLGFYQGSELRGRFELTAAQIADGKSYFNAVIQHSGQAETLTKAVLWIPQSGILYDLSLDIPMPLPASYADYDQIQTFSFSEVLFDQDIIATLSVGMIENLTTQEDQQLLIDASLLWGEVTIERSVDQLFSQGQGGLSWIQAGQQFSYQPALHFIGTEWVFVPVPASTGLVSFYAKVTVESVNDAPVISLTNPVVTHEAGQVYADEGASATDIEDDDATVSAAILIGGDLVDNNTDPGVYEITYDVTDSGGLAAVQVVRTVIVVDTTAPVLTVGKLSPYVVEAGSVFAAPTATASDIVDGDLSSEIKVTVNVNTQVLGDTHQVNYEVTDTSGNTASSTLMVSIVDTTTPTITIAEASPYVVEAGSTFVAPTATASDIVDGDLSSEIKVTVNVDTQVLGDTHQVNYEVTDTSGNTASSTLMVSIVDTTTPTITIAEASPYVVEAG